MSPWGAPILGHQQSWAWVLTWSCATVTWLDPGFLLCLSLPPLSFHKCLYFFPFPCPIFLSQPMVEQSSVPAPHTHHRDSGHHLGHQWKTPAGKYPGTPSPVDPRLPCPHAAHPQPSRTLQISWSLSPTQGTQSLAAEVLVTVTPGSAGWSRSQRAREACYSPGPWSALLEPHVWRSRRHLGAGSELKCHGRGVARARPGCLAGRPRLQESLGCGRLGEA